MDTETVLESLTHPTKMAENVGSDESEFESITSSQKSYLKNCPFAGHEDSLTDSDNTEVLGNQISPSIVKTPILSFSSPTSLDSINDDVFRTPPENASLSSAADSEPRVRVSEIKPRGGSNLKSPSSNAETMLLSSSPSGNFRVLESNLNSPSSTAETTRVLESNLKSPSSTPETTPVSASPSEKVRALETNVKSPSSTAETTPVSSSPSIKVRVLETKCLSDSVPLSSPPSVVADDVRVPATHLDSDSPSPTGTMDLKNPIFASVTNNGALKSSERVLNLGSASASAAEGIKVSETESSGGDLPFKEIIEALLRNSGEKLNKRDENVSYVEILKQCGLKFP